MGRSIRVRPRRARWRVPEEPRAARAEMASVVRSGAEEAPTAAQRAARAEAQPVGEVLVAPVLAANPEPTEARAMRGTAAPIPMLPSVNRQATTQAPATHTIHRCTPPS